MNKIRLLIVDDSVNICKTLHIILKKYNYDILTEYDSSVAVDIAIKFKPHIILSDYKMPKLNGLQFCEIVRKTDIIQNCIFIIMTDKELTDEIKEQFHDLPDGWISKNKGLKNLTNELNKWINCTADSFNY